MPKGIPLTNDEINQRRGMIARAAASMILEKGFQETSIKKMTLAAGIGKSTYYDYFTSKDDLLLFLLNEILQDLTQRSKAILVSGGNVIERLRKQLHIHLDFLLADRAYYLRLGWEVQRLSAESQARFQQMRYSYMDLIRNLVEEGIARGEFRLTKADTVVNTLMSVLSAVAFTGKPSGSPQAMLDEALEIILNGIQS